MKKVGILTYHYSMNEGAMLQAYALKQICKNIFKGHDVEIINYESLREKKADFLSCFQNPKNVKAVIKKLTRYYRLDKFKRKYFDLSKPGYLGDNYFLGAKFLNERRYDLIIVGSDEVWKIKDQYGFGKDASNAYWLGPEIDCQKASYAASAHKTLYNRLSEKYKDFIIKGLKEFQLIGVRDDHTFNLVQSCIGKESENKLFKVLDPTLLYDFSEEGASIDEVFLKNNIDLNSPIAIFATENEKASKWARKILKDKNYQIISIGHYNKHADFNLFDQINPLEWASIFERCNFCVTDRFHGTIFSIKNKVPFITIDHLNMYKKFKSKTKQILEDFRLVDRLIDLSNTNYDYNEFVNKIELSLKHFDGDKVEKILQHKKEESLIFLKNIKNLL